MKILDYKVSLLKGKTDVFCPWELKYFSPESSDAPANSDEGISPGCGGQMLQTYPKWKGFLWLALIENFSLWYIAWKWRVGFGIISSFNAR